MTSARPTVAARVRGYASDVCTAAPRSSRNYTHGSQDRDGWPQIRSHVAECEVRLAMIGVMREPPDHPLTDRPPDRAGDTSAYRSSYTVGDTKAKEVS